MNKKFISIILIAAILNLFGCYSYSALTEKEVGKRKFTIKDDVKLILSDGSEVICEYNNNPKTFYVKVDEPSDMIYGRGNIIYNNQSPSILFWGDIPREMIDSSDFSYINQELHKQFWLKDNTKVTLKEGEYFDITTEDGIGFWVSGTKDESPFYGKVKTEDIREIQINKVNWVTTGLLMGVVIGVFVALIITMSKTSRIDIDFGGLPDSK
jgi:hypothetical protein